MAEHDVGKSSRAIRSLDRGDDPAEVGELYLDTVCISKDEQLGGLAGCNISPGRTLDARRGYP
jgi:hypothetical protein